MELKLIKRFLVLSQNEENELRRFLKLMLLGLRPN